MLTPATAAVAVADPTVSGSTLTWSLSLPVGVSTSPSRLRPDCTLARPRLGHCLDHRRARRRPGGVNRFVMDAFTSGYHSSSTPYPLAPDTITLGYIPQRRPGLVLAQRRRRPELSLSLSNLPADYD